MASCCLLEKPHHSAPTATSLSDICVCVLFRFSYVPNKKMVVVLLTAKDLSMLRMIRPRTHEIGGTLLVSPEGTIGDIRLAGGSACRDDQGRLLPGKVCSVRHPTGPVVFHTPKSEPPLEYGSEKRGESWKHTSGRDSFGCMDIQGSLTPELVRKWKQWDVNRRRRAVLEWRFLGHRSQRATQSGDTQTCKTGCCALGFPPGMCPTRRLERTKRGKYLFLIAKHNTWEKKEEYPWTHFMTTHVWWASVLATLLHISVPESPSVLIDSAFALTFGVMLTGSMVSCDWFWIEQKDCLSFII